MYDGVVLCGLWWHEYGRVWPCVAVCGRLQLFDGPHVHDVVAGGTQDRLRLAKPNGVDRCTIGCPTGCVDLPRAVVEQRQSPRTQPDRDQRTPIHGDGGTEGGGPLPLRKVDGAGDLFDGIIVKHDLRKMENKTENETERHGNEKKETDWVRV